MNESEFDEFLDRVDGMILDRDGKPISHREWGRLRQREDYYRVAQHRLNGLWVSTVWLGINHEGRPDAPPLIFETMVFPDDAAASDWDYQDRYSTLPQARVGHERVVAAIRTGQSCEDFTRSEDGRLLRSHDPEMRQ